MLPLALWSWDIVSSAVLVFPHVCNGITNGAHHGGLKGDVSETVHMQYHHNACQIAVTPFTSAVLELLYLVYSSDTWGSSNYHFSLGVPNSACMGDHVI